MVFDMGLQGLGALLLLSLAFGAIAQLLFLGRGVRWVWAAGAVAFFAVGMLISEVWFGWATGADLQPNIDGLSFDEVLVGFAVGIAVVVVLRVVSGRRGNRPAGV